MRHRHSVYIIAEAGVNHNGEEIKAFELIDAAAMAGADAVKFQTFNAKKLARQSAPKAAYQKRTTDINESQVEMLSRLELPVSLHCKLQKYANSKGIDFLSTAFDLDSLKFLETLNLPLYKIPSGEITNAPLLWAFANTKKPMILSTGMATMGEVESAVAILSHGISHDKEPNNLQEVMEYWSSEEAHSLVKKQVTLLHCTSQYPTPMQNVNLLAMDTLQNTFNLPVGYSDHTEGNLVPIAAVARGAKVIEKHFTLDRTMEGPDHKASLEPEQLVRMVKEIRDVEVALGNGIKRPQVNEWSIRRAARQQVITNKKISAGSVIKRDDITTARCGHGKSGTDLWGLVGSIASQNYNLGDVVE